MTRHANLLTHVEYGTGRAFGANPGADVLAERHQQPVDLDVMVFGKCRFECDHRPLRGCRPHVSPAVGDPVDMDINADPGLTARHTQTR